MAVSGPATVGVGNNNNPATALDVKGVAPR